MLGRFLSADIFRVNSSASSPRSPPESAERSPDVRRSPPKIFFGGRPADPRGTGRSPRVSARIRANPRRKFFRRASSRFSEFLY